ncbi:hypothetical protein [Micromonospora sp. 067-2]|uniref:hypothetical protein n=1 Tax=Micromonospora sp. 067-2 TaxID=2789270 RepID=UPI00397A5A9E
MLSILCAESSTPHPIVNFLIASLIVTAHHLLVVGIVLKIVILVVRMARDYETHPTTSAAMIRWASIGGMLHRLTRGKPASRQQRRTFNTPD